MQPTVKIRTRYSERSPSGLRFTAPSRVKQEFAKESDVNQQVTRFFKTGLMPQATSYAQHPRFGDFTEVNDYQDVINRVMRFEDDFQSLPAELRAKFRNDPAELLHLLQNKPDEAVRLGIIDGNSTPLDVTVPVDTGKENPPVASPVQTPNPEA